MEEEKSTDIDLGLQDLLDILRHCWWIMLAVAIVAGIALYVGMNAMHKDEFSSQASIYVTRSTETGSSVTSSSDLSLATYLAKDCPELVKSRAVLGSIAEYHGMSYEELKPLVQVSNKSDTRLVYITVTVKDASKAASIATDLADRACEFMNDDMYDGQKLFRVVDEGVVPTKPSNPISILTVLLIAVAAAVVVYVIYLIMFLLDDKINGPEDVEKYLQLSILGQIPNKQDSGRKKKYYAYDASTK